MDRQDAEQVSFCHTLIYDAIRHQKSSHRLLRAIQNYPNDVHLREPDTCYTYLHLVVATGDEESEVAMVPMIYQLSNAGIDVDSKDCKNRTALELAMVKGLRVLVVALLRVGTDQKTKDYRAIIDSLRSPRSEAMMEDFDRYTPDIWDAATTGDFGSVYVLVNSWCRVKVRRHGLTLLEHLRRRGGDSQMEMVSLLASYEMTIEFVHATLAGDEEAMLDILMDESHSDVDILDISYVDPQLGSLRPRSLRDTAIALNHPGRILQLLTPKCKRYDPSTGIPEADLVLHTGPTEPDAFLEVADGGDLTRNASQGTLSSHHPKLQRENALESTDCRPSLTLSGIEPTVTSEEESDEEDETNGLLFCTYRSFKDDDEEFKVTEEVKGTAGVKDVKVNKKVKDNVTNRANEKGMHQNKDNKFKNNDRVSDNGKVKDNSRTSGDAVKDSQSVFHHDNDKGTESGSRKWSRNSSREEGQSNTETPRRREDRYVELSGSEDAEWQRGTGRTKNGRKSTKSSLCVVS